MIFDSVPIYCPLQSRWSPVDHETDRNYLHALKSADRGLVIGITELALYVDGNCKFSSCGAGRLRDKGIAVGKRKVCTETGSCSLH
jgi:hypothetical protein